MLYTSDGGWLVSQESSESKIDKILALWRGSGSNDYETVKKELMDLRTFVQEEIAGRFTPVFNQALQARRKDTLADKQEISRWANAEMRELQLCVKTDTGKPAVLRAAQGRKPDTGRFQLELLGNKSGRGRVKDSAVLFALELMPAPQKELGILNYWARRIDNSDLDSERKTR